MLTYIDLVLLNGELVRIECPSKLETELHDSIEHSLKRRDWWSPSQFDKCTATYLGLTLGRVNMAQVAATL